MSARSVAKRYAAALFDVTHKAGSQEGAGRSLAEFSQLIDGHAELGRVLASPAVPAGVKRDIVSALMDAAGDVPLEVRRMLTLLAERDRLMDLPDVSAAFTQQLMETQRVVQADVVTAVPLSDASRAALTAALGRATGKSVTISERVDPAIVGGVVARVGTFVYDASVTRQLERLRQKLTASN
jgi:F-type H+-transporting ATPase subunit delta